MSSLNNRVDDASVFLPPTRRNDEQERSARAIRPAGSGVRSTVKKSTTQGDAKRDRQVEIARPPLVPVVGRNTAASVSASAPKGRLTKRASAGCKTQRACVTGPRRAQAESQAKPRHEPFLSAARYHQLRHRRQQAAARAPCRMQLIREFADHASPQRRSEREC